MPPSYHILNGDALKSQVENWLSGDLIVARECLIEGPVSGSFPETFYRERAQFLSKAYGGTPQEYRENTGNEFSKIQGIPSGADIHLWFEEDLFCQTNLWFVAHLLNEKKEGHAIFLVLPDDDLRYGFGGMDREALRRALDRKMPLPSEAVTDLTAMWTAYRQNDPAKMSALGDRLQVYLPRIHLAIQAHQERLPDADGWNRPLRSLARIKAELNTDDFGKVFAAFCEREAIYGFGDLQVRRMWEGLTS